MKVVEYLPEALNELHAAASYHEAKVPKYGARFLNDAERTCEILQEFPLFGRELDDVFRRVNLPSFPYFFAYVIRGDRIIIAAVSHSSRHPDYWKDRIP